MSIAIDVASDAQLDRIGQYDVVGLVRTSKSAKYDTSVVNFHFNVFVQTASYPVYGAHTHQSLGGGPGGGGGTVVTAGAGVIGGGVVDADARLGSELLLLNLATSDDTLPDVDKLRRGCSGVAGNGGGAPLPLKPALGAIGGVAGGFGTNSGADGGGGFFIGLRNLGESTGADVGGGNGASSSSSSSSNASLPSSLWLVATPEAAEMAAGDGLLGAVKSTSLSSLSLPAPSIVIVSAGGGADPFGVRGDSSKLTVGHDVVAWCALNELERRRSPDRGAARRGGAGDCCESSSLGSKITLPSSVSSLRPLLSDTTA